jgi:hypothetical protein
MEQVGYVKKSQAESNVWLRTEMTEMLTGQHPMLD